MKKIHILPSNFGSKVRNASFILFCRLPILLVLLVLTVFSVCSSCTDEGKYDFRTRQDALSEYGNYLKKVRAITHTNTKDFGETLHEWHEISDTVYKFLKFRI